MSHSNALQTLVFQRLTSFAPLVALVGVRVYDAPPATAVFPYISFGPMDAVPDDADLVDLESQSLQIDVWSKAVDGQRQCKAICDQVRRAFKGFTGNLTTGAMAGAEVAQFRVIPDPQDGLHHGVITVEFLVEGPA
jgi:hypothetical protein